MCSDYFYRSPEERESKDGDYMKCPKCGRTMEILFNVRKCPTCDRPAEKRENSSYVENTWTRKNKIYFL